MPAKKSANKPGPESTLGAVRQRLVAAATADLADRGIDIGLGHITLADAIQVSGVTRSTAYRSLADDTLSPQDVLRRDVLTDMLSRHARDSNLVQVQAAVGAELERQAENLASSDLATRTAAFRQLIRIGTTASYREVAESSERSILAVAYGSLQSSGADDWRLEALTHGEAQAAVLFADLYSEFAGMVHHKLRDGYTMEHFATAGASTLEGLALRHGISDHLDNIERPTTGNGDPETWTLYGIIFESLFTTFFEPVDPDDPVVDMIQH